MSTKREIMERDALGEIGKLLARGLPIPGELAPHLVGRILSLQVGRLSFKVIVEEVRGIGAAELRVKPISGSGSTWLSTVAWGTNIRFQGPIVDLFGEKD